MWMSPVYVHRDPFINRSSNRHRNVTHSVHKRLVRCVFVIGSKHLNSLLVVSSSFLVLLIIVHSKKLPKNRIDNYCRKLIDRFLLSIRDVPSSRRRHYLAISAPAVPPAPEAPFPGPGAYELRDFKEAEKKYMSTAAFVSNTSRWTIDTTAAAQQPGPSSYAPYTVPAKQSFNFNFERKWI